MNEQPPAASDEDEFAGLAPPARRRRPVVALAVIALGVVISVHLIPDLRYAFRPRSPIELGEARALASGALTDNSYVALRGLPDRRHALTLEPGGAASRQDLYRLFGAGSRLLVRTADLGRRADPADRFVGRLRRFDALSWAEPLRSYYRSLTAIHFLSLEAVRAALAAGSATVRDRTGAMVTLAAGDPLLVDVVFPDQLRVSLGRDRFASLADARHELERFGWKLGDDPAAEPAAGGRPAQPYRFIVEAPAAERDAMLARLEERQLRFATRTERVLTHFGELRGDSTQLKLQRLGPVRWSQVRGVGVPSPLEVAPDAFVLLEGEAPGALLWAPLLEAVLVAFMLFNLWYLLRPRRA